MQIANLYSKEEIDALVPEGVKRIVREEKAQRLEQSRQAAANLRDVRKESRAERQQFIKELREMQMSSRRWIVTTIVSCAVAMTGCITAYLTIVMKMHS